MTTFPCEYHTTAEEAMSFAEHQNEVTAVSVHPVSDYFASFSKDSSWNFYDLNQGRLLRKVEIEDQGGFLCGSFHPDGLVLATGKS